MDSQEDERVVSMPVLCLPVPMWLRCVMRASRTPLSQSQLPHGKLMLTPHDSQLDNLPAQWPPACTQAQDVYTNKWAGEQALNFGLYLQIHP